MSATYEMDILMLLARRNELKYMNALDFNTISERQLIGKQMKIVEIMKYIRSANLHSQLYDILKHRLFHKGYMRSEKQKNKLNDLILSELNLIANDSYKGFETQKLHLLFQSAYYLDSGNYKMAVRFYRTLIDLFESNKHMILNPPIYYLQALTGNYPDARKNMKKITSSGKLFYALPAYRYARLLNLLLQAELKNYDFFENEIKSIKRNIRYEKHGYITEKLLFKFILHHHLLDQPKTREQLLKQLRKERPKIIKNKYEQQLLSFFDFISWMESKLSNRPFGELLTPNANASPIKE